MGRVILVFSIFVARVINFPISFVSMTFLKRRKITFRTLSKLSAEYFVSKQGKKLRCDLWKTYSYTARNSLDTDPVTSIHVGQEKWSMFFALAKETVPGEKFCFDLNIWSWSAKMNVWAVENDTTAFLIMPEDLDELCMFDRLISEGQ
jgi:hypothetical protein